jgi:hypothetical protein
VAATAHGRPRDDYYLTRQSAELFAESIRSFWEAKGLVVRVWVEPFSDTATTEFVVRSNISLVERRS